MFTLIKQPTTLVNVPVDHVDQERQHINHLLAQFDAIHLDEMQDVALLDRVDTKYVIGLDQLFAILPQVADHYRALTINAVRLHTYQTLYFDTCAFDFYMQHHNGIASRYKVRERRYVDTDTAFFEIKHRTNQHRTIKYRLPIPDVLPSLDDQVVEFTAAHARCDAAALEPKLWNEYMRLTLVSKHYPERVTVDVDLQYHWQQAYAMQPGIVIVEVKQARRSQPAAFIRELRQMGLRPLSYSKYAAGVYSLYSHVKANNFKQQMRQVNKVMQGVRDHEFVS